MKQENEQKYYDEVKDWDFSKFEIESESLTKYHISLPIITKKYYNKEKLNDFSINIELYINII